MIFPEEDLPFIAAGPNAGIRPDIIMSCHAYVGPYATIPNFSNTFAESPLV